MSAVLSPCGKFRFRLEREGLGDGSTLVVMINPSTADAERDDATIRKLKGFGARNGWGRIMVGNLFAYRATDVRELAKIDPYESYADNLRHLTEMMGEADRIVVAWGPSSKLPKGLRDRWRDIPHRAAQWGKVLYSIGEPAKDGHPKHPLMLPYSSPLLRWTPPL